MLIIHVLMILKKIKINKFSVKVISYIIPSICQPKVEINNLLFFNYHLINLSGFPVFIELLYVNTHYFIDLIV